MLTAARVSGKHDGDRRVETIEALTIDAKSTYGSEQLTKNIREMPPARRSGAPPPRVMQELVSVWRILWARGK
jgi:hypothetical protein